MELERVESILTQIAKVEEITNYETIPHKNALKGDGFLSEFYTGDVLNKESGDIIKTYIKLPPKYNVSIKSEIYSNEIQFYSKIFPELDSFQKEKGVKVSFDNIPKFYCGDNELGNEYIALENLAAENYVLYDKTKFLTEDHLKLIFATYGKYHALTFAFKQQNPELYNTIKEPLRDVLPTFAEFSNLGPCLKSVLAQASDNIKKINEEYAEKIKPYAKNPKEVFAISVAYLGEYSTLVHGDCWSNNMLFKYLNNGMIDKIKLLDFQLLRDSTPVHDLAYFFYCGASKKDFDRLDDYLEVYYEHFSAFAEELGSDPQLLLPKDVLKTEWKKWSIWGILMSIYVWQLKLLKKKKIAEMGEDGGSLEDHFRESITQVWHSATFQDIIQDILIHAIESNII